MVSMDMVMQGGALCVLLLGVLVLPRAPYPRAELLSLVGLSAAGGLITGRLLWWVVANQRRPSGVDVHVLWSFSEGGIGSVGVLVGAMCSALCVMALLDMRKHKEIADFLAPLGMFALGMARLGCMFHGCDFGVELEPQSYLTSLTWLSHLGGRYFPGSAPAWSWFSLTGGLLPDGGTPWLRPFAFVLGVGNLLISIVFFVLFYRRTLPVGWVALGVGCVYSAWRLVLEGWRHDAAGALVSGMNVNQALMACALVVWCGVGVFWLMMARRKKEDV